MTLIYRLLRYFASLELGHAIYRRDLINHEIATGRGYDINELWTRRAAIDKEVKAAQADYDRWDRALLDLAFQAKGKA